MNERLKEITAVILDAEVGYAAVRNACNDLSDFFYEIAAPEKSAPEFDAHIETANGLAVAPMSAAFCIIDFMRTQKFLMGIKQAVEDRLQKNKNEPVVILYAGTGPFATLVIPLTSVFSASQVQFVLLELNPVSINCLQKMITALGLQHYISALIQADAASYLIDEKNQPDIIVSETMRPGLMKEPQVSIIANLLPQCIKQPVLIPQKIIIKTAWAKNKTGTTVDVQLLGTLMEFSEKMAIAINVNMQQERVLTDGVEQKILQKPEPAFTTLVLLTEIIVYKKHEIKFNESSLTIPHKIMEVKDIKSFPVRFVFKYGMGKIPGFTFEMF